MAARLLDRRYEKIGKDISCSVTLDSDIYNPVYNYRVEFREPNMPPSSTLIIKVGNSNSLIRLTIKSEYRHRKLNDYLRLQFTF